jgi:hypothetical protein
MEGFAMSRPILVLAAAALALLSGCRTEQTLAPAGLSTSRPLLLVPQRTWRVVESGELRGIVVLMAPEDAATQRSKHLYSVRNPLQQELGVIDGLGRAWRHEPHVPEPRWVATGTLREGVSAILAAGSSADLVEVTAPPAR